MDKHFNIGHPDCIGDYAERYGCTRSEAKSEHDDMWKDVVDKFKQMESDMAVKMQQAPPTQMRTTEPRQVTSTRKKFADLLDRGRHPE